MPVQVRGLLLARFCLAPKTRLAWQRPFAGNGARKLAITSSWLWLVTSRWLSKALQDRNCAGDFWSVWLWRQPPPSPTRRERLPPCLVGRCHRPRSWLSGRGPGEWSKPWPPSSVAPSPSSTPPATTPSRSMRGAHAMRLDNAFRLSIYCCLVLASLCLTYAEQLYLPAFFVFGLGFSVFL